MQKLLGLLVALLFGTALAQTTVTIASVNNPDMVTMQELSSVFEAANPDIKLEWLFLDEGTLRSRLTTDVATGSGAFDLVTVGAYETPLWAANDWIVSVDKLSEANPEAAETYDFDDLLPAIRDGLSYNGELFAVPFYAESSFTMYNKRLFDEAGLTMPEQPTWEQIADFACQLNDPENGVYGIALRGKPGWGDNMAPITTVVNTFGGQWFDAEGHPQLDSQAWHDALTFYADLVNRCGPPGVTGNSFPESLQLMSTGKAAMWVDATVAAGFLAGSEAGPDMAQALAPVGPVAKGNAWLWSWNLAIPASSDAQEAAYKFMTWATSKDYIELVAAEKGWAAIPPGTRKSTYERQEYLDAAPFATMTLNAILNADPTDSTLEPQVAPGVQFVQIPEFQGIGTDVAQQVAAALAGDISVDEALANSQKLADEAMKDAGYY
ncbi:MAG: sugar ABC transporter substrate-binding protein [Trueperaceae bacterium]|nr:sugar ABC transporter substrate-binding protein [Trueperaceae bacterium]